jgi:hypothetical protein
MTRFGASPEEWAHFSEHLGLTADLLPVVSRPDAPISPDSKMRALGKTPSIYNQRRQVAGIPNWTQHKATAASVKRWATEDDYGICLQTRLVRALDIDVSDPGEAEAIADVIEDFGLPCRKRSNSPKRLFVFVLPGDMPKRSFRCAGGLVEALMTGQQFICSGTHPTAVRYEWADGLPERIPELTLEQFERLWAALVDGFATAAPVGGALRKRDEMIEGLDDPVAEWLIDKGLVLGEGRDGALYLTCPWIDEHSSDSGLTETAWFPSGSNGYATGAFKCLHAHCDGRTADDFVKAIGYVEASFDVVEVELRLPLMAKRCPSMRPEALCATARAASRHRYTTSPSPWKPLPGQVRPSHMTSSSKTSSSRPSAPTSGDRSSTRTMCRCACGWSARHSSRSAGS